MYKWLSVCMLSVCFCLCVSESQCLKLDDRIEDPEDDPFTSKLSFEVRGFT